MKHTTAIKVLINNGGVGVNDTNLLGSKVNRGIVQLNLKMG